MRRFFASTLLALGLTGGIASAGPWHREVNHGPVYRDARVRAFNRGFDRGRGYERHEFRRDWRGHRGWDRRW
jgi:hypothetical protein